MKLIADKFHLLVPGRNSNQQITGSIGGAVIGNT